MLEPWTSICEIMRENSPEYSRYWYHRWERKNGYENPSSYRPYHDDYFCMNCGNEILDD